MNYNTPANNGEPFRLRIGTVKSAQLSKFQPKTSSVYVMKVYPSSDT